MGKAICLTSKTEKVSTLRVEMKLLLLLLYRNYLVDFHYSKELLRVPLKDRSLIYALN